MGKFKDFLSYLQQQVDTHSIYVWGGQGETGGKITEAWIRRMETSTANANRAISFWKKQIAAGYGSKLRAFDCSGLAVYFLLANGLLKSDTTADGLRGHCEKINRASLRKGDWVFRVSNGKAYHIGYVVDDKLNVIEAMGRDSGVVKRGLNASGTSYWNAYGRPRKFFGAELDQPTAPTAYYIPAGAQIYAAAKPPTQSHAVTLESYKDGDSWALVKNIKTGKDIIIRAGDLIKK